MKKVTGFLKGHPILIIAVLCAIAPLCTNSIYLTHMIFMCMMFGILASSLNIAVGLTGLSNLAHATFFGIGAYAAAILSTRFHVPFYLTFFAGAIVAAVFGAALGAPTLRLRGVFLSLATVGFGQIMRIVEVNWVSLTRGPSGITGIGAAKIGSYRFSKLAYIYYGLLILVFCMYLTKRIMRSKMGRALFSIKYDETCAQSLGVNVTRYKVAAYVLSAALAGVAGTIYAHYISFISPDSFTAADSTTILCMVILGGAGSLVGPVVGALILTIAPELFRFADLWRIIFVGIVMVVGIIAQENKWIDKVRYRIKQSKEKKTAKAGGE